jgi:anti-sigma regulatory factor (Ser/Thr protein kinase)
VLLLADVAGKGSPAAILTAVVHATFRSEVSHWSDPAILLQVMSHLLHPDLDRAETFVTVVVVRLESNPLGFTYSSAGHVDVPLWRNGDQELMYLPATGLPLGIDPGATYNSKHVKLEPGDVLLLYSDGVTETENIDGKVLGLQGLSDIIYATYPAAVDDQIRVVVEALDVHRNSLPLRDDVALLIVRALPVEKAPAKVVPFVFPAEVTAASGLVTLVQEIGATLPLVGAENRRHFADDFALAASEIVTNQITHAYQGRRGRIQGRIMVEADRLVADLFDNGVPFQSPKGTKSAIDLDNPPEKGYGLMMVRGLLDSFEYRRLDGGRNHWRLVKNFTGADKR